MNNNLNDLSIVIEDGVVLFKSESFDETWRDDDLAFELYKAINLVDQHTSMVNQERKERSYSSLDLNKPSAKLFRLITDNIPEQYFYFVYHMLDNFGLEEHGSSAPGWIPREPEAQELYNGLKDIFGPIYVDLESGKITDDHR